ncbi:DNA-directed RNA polymerase [Candidatus Bathyarchaeota archaeon]|nr:DNA-directed RNA polymerase [Candidatus Bathyarchaeota archaeon]
MGYERRSYGGPREMHKATCSDCKQECEVPFKPTEGKPVYCRDCYQKHRRY